MAYALDPPRLSACQSPESLLIDFRTLSPYINKLESPEVGPRDLYFEKAPQVILHNHCTN